jgi:hypothetical protein
MVALPQSMSLLLDEPVLGRYELSCLSQTAGFIRFATDKLNS